LKIRADEHVTFRLVQALQSLNLKQGLELSHVRDVHPARTSDETWLPAFAADGGKAILSGDAAMLKRPHQIVAVQDSGLICFILSQRWTKARLHQQMANILWQWPKIEVALKNAGPGDCFPVPFEFDDKPLEEKKINYEAARKAAVAKPS
jgi:hypothetical protein